MGGKGRGISSRSLLVGHDTQGVESARHCCLLLGRKSTGVSQDSCLIPHRDGEGRLLTSPRPLSSGGKGGEECRRKGYIADVNKKNHILTKIKVGTPVGARRHIKHPVKVQTSRARVW